MNRPIGQFTRAFHYRSKRRGRPRYVVGTSSPDPAFIRPLDRPYDRNPGLLEVRAVLPCWGSLGPGFDREDGLATTARARMEMPWPIGRPPHFPRGMANSPSQCLPTWSALSSGYAGQRPRAGLFVLGFVHDGEQPRSPGPRTRDRHPGRFSGRWYAMRPTKELAAWRSGCHVPPRSEGPLRGREKQTPNPPGHLRTPRRRDSAGDGPTLVPLTSWCQH